MTQINENSLDTPATWLVTRRRLLQSSGLGLATTAGCLAELGFTRQSSRVPPLVENRPDAVYHPTHVEAMNHIDTNSTGPYAISLALGFPHRFWTVTGKNRSKVGINREDSIHLMVGLWHEPTEVVLPIATPAVTIELDGDPVEDRKLWPMLSQRMGVHFGDNVSLPKAASYDVIVSVPPIGTRVTGSFQDDFEEHRETSFSLEFNPESIRTLEFTQFPEQAGTPTAVAPMDMHITEVSQLPKPGGLPGSAIGEAKRGDGVFVVRALESPPHGIEDSGRYLAVSPRTPYNRYPLSLLSLSATLERAGDTLLSTQLVPTLDADLGYHLGTTVNSILEGDELTITVDAPPQVSRHEGYETAFFDFQPMSFTL